MNVQSKSSFAGLVGYITDTQGKAERVALTTITNCESTSIKWALSEVRSVQAKNTRATSDKTYHLLIGFAPGEHPSNDVLREIESRICNALGYGEHQRISAVHTDTDSLHIHVAINKIHPTKHTLHEPYRDYKIRSAVCAELEVEFGLQRVDHRGRKSAGENKANDIEHIAGVESLIGWIKRGCKTQLANAQSWSEFHGVLREHGLELKSRGNGLVVSDGAGTFVKASSIGREFSKSSLESRFGAFADAEHLDAKATDRHTRAQSIETQKPVQSNRTKDRVVSIYRADAWTSLDSWTLDHKLAAQSARTLGGDVRFVRVKEADLVRLVDLRGKQPDSFQVDTGLLMRAALSHEKRPPRPPLGEVGKRPPPRARGRAPFANELEHLAIESASTSSEAARASVDVSSTRKSADFERRRPPIGRVGRTPPPRAKGRAIHAAALGHAAIESAPRYQAAPLKSRVDTTKLYAQYQAQQQSIYARRRGELDLIATRRKQEIEQTKEAGRIRRSAIKLVGGSIGEKRLSYALAHKRLKDDIDAIRARYDRERAILISSNPKLSWADWLQQQAKANNAAALVALRARDARTVAASRRAEGSIPAGVNVPAGVAVDGVTKKGTIIYRSGGAAVRDDGERLSVSRGADHAGVEAALRLAMARYGSRVSVNGSAAFKAAALRAAVAAKLNLQFDDPLLEAQRQALSSKSTPTRKSDERTRTDGHGGHRGRDGRVRSGANDGARRPDDARRGTRYGVPGADGAGVRDSDIRIRPDRRDERGVSKPRVGRVGKEPPPQSKHRLRSMSECGVASIEQGSPVLLPRNVPHHLVHEAARSGAELRRPLADGRLTPGQVAAEKYAAERNEKRTLGFEISKHTRYNGGVSGVVKYAGVRVVDGEALALLQHDDGIAILPIERRGVSRLKSLRIGEPVSLTKEGTIEAPSLKSKARAKSR